MWRSAETQHIDIRTRSRRNLPEDLERAARRAIATGCRRLVIELNAERGLHASLVGALGLISELMLASHGELVVVHRSGRELEQAAPAPIVSAQFEPADHDWPAKWAA